MNRIDSSTPCPRTLPWPVSIGGANSRGKGGSGGGAELAEVGTEVDVLRAPFRLWPKACLAALSLVGAWAFPQTAAIDAQDVLIYRAGPLTVKPQAAVSEVYNDNIFYLRDNPVSDFITTISPGLKLQLGRPERNYLSLGYTYDQLLYLDNSHLDAGQHGIELHDRLEGAHLSLVGNDRIQFLSSPLGGVERVLSARNIDRSLFDDVYTLTYDLSERTEVYLRGAYSSLNYQEGIDLYDVDTLVGTGGFAYRLLPKTLVFGEVYYGETGTNPNSANLAKNPSLRFVGGYAGARGNFTEKLTGAIKVGYEAREFVDGTSAPSDPVVDVTLTERFTDKTSLSLSYSRQNSVSSQFTRQSYSANVIGLQLRQVLGASRKWEANLGGTYYDYAYDLNGEATGTTYRYARASFSLAYRIQLWLTASLGYDFELLTSNVNSTSEYAVDRVTLRIAVGY